MLISQKETCSEKWLLGTGLIAYCRHAFSLYLPHSPINEVCFVGSRTLSWQIVVINLCKQSKHRAADDEETFLQTFHINQAMNGRLTVTVWRQSFKTILHLLSSQKKGRHTMSNNAIIFLRQFPFTFFTRFIKSMLKQKDTKCLWDDFRLTVFNLLIRT